MPKWSSTGTAKATLVMKPEDIRQEVTSIISSRFGQERCTATNNMAGVNTPADIGPLRDELLALPEGQRTVDVETTVRGGSTPNSLKLKFEFEVGDNDHEIAIEIADGIQNDDFDVSF